jgi:hypothetical protein
MTPAPQPSREELKSQRKREFCPYCGAEDFDCEKPLECQREIAAEERDAMEREIQEVRERHGYY